MSLPSIIFLVNSYVNQYQNKNCSNFSCQQLKKTALDIMKNRQLDSELRIKGFLAVIGCPCGKSANEIKTLLESEPVHQGEDWRDICCNDYCDKIINRLQLVL